MQDPTKFLTEKNYSHIEHAVEVTKIIEDAGITDETTKVAALLHDALDCSQATSQEISNLFGSEVAGICEELFHDLRNPCSNLLADIVRKAPSYSEPAAAVLLADFIASAKIENFEFQTAFLSRLVLVAIRNCVSLIATPNPVLLDRLNSELSRIYQHLGFPDNESQQDVWNDMERAATGAADYFHVSQHIANPPKT